MFSLPVLIARGLDLQYAGISLVHISPSLFSFQGASPERKRKPIEREESSDIVGVSDGEGPPVPIPNTEVKLTSAENTCLATDWKDRSTPTQRTPGEILGFFFAYIKKW